MAKNPTQSTAATATAVATTKAAASQTAELAKKKMEGNTTATVRAVGVERRCRAGMCFDIEGSPVDFATLDAEKIKALVDDPHLKIDATPVDAGQDDGADDAGGKASE
jgi:hypothetical protein